MDYPVRVERESGGRIRVVLPDFPGIQGLGADEAEGRRHAQEALEGAIDTHIRERRPIPSPSAVGQSYIAVPALIAAKIRLYDAMRAGGVGKAELARRLRCHMPQVDRLLDVRHASRLEQLEAAFAVLGKRLVVDVQEEGPAAGSRPHGKTASRAAASRPAERPAPAGPATPAFEVQWD